MSLGPMSDDFNPRTGMRRMENPPKPPQRKPRTVKCKNCGANKLEGEKCEYCDTY